MGKNENKTPLIYTELFLPIRDYLTTIKCNECINDIIVPLIISAIGLTVVNQYNVRPDYLGFLQTIIPLLSILIGFNITCIVILLTSNSENIQLLKDQICIERKLIGGKNITLFQLTLMNYSHVLLVQIGLLVLCVTALFVQNLLGPIAFICLTTFLLFMLLHVLFVTVRNTANLYLTFWKK